MKRRVARWVFAGLVVWGGVLSLGGVSGCSNSFTGTTIDPMLLEVWDENADQLRAEQAKRAAAKRVERIAAKQAAAREKEIARKKREKEEEERRKNEPPPLQIDSNKVAQMQRQALNAQGDSTDSFIQRQNRVTHWMDEFHAMWYCRMDNAVRLVDTKWLKKDGQPYDYELSTFYLRVLSRVGGRSQDDAFDFKVRFSGDVALPGLEDKLHLVLNNVARDTLPGQDPLDQERQASVGVRTMWRSIRNSELSLGGGLRWRSNVPVVYGELDWRWHKDIMGGKRCMGSWTGDGTTISWGESSVWIPVDSGSVMTALANGSV